MAKIFLSMPILDHPELKFIFSVYQAILSCKEHQVRAYYNENDSLISRVRNVHMSIFLNDYPDFDYFMSIDSDLEVVNAFTTNNIFSKLIAHNKEFVGGLYALKQTENEPICSSQPLDNAISRTKIPFDKGLLEMRWLSSGCWCLKRSAVEKMVKAYPELTYVGDDNVSGKTIHGLYIPQIFEVDGQSEGKTFRKYLSEDWSFAERWRKIGGQIWADTSIVLRHIGKISHSLWKVEIVAHKQPVPSPETQRLPKPQQLLNVLPGAKIIPLDVPQKSDVPPAGFDLNKEIK